MYIEIEVGFGDDVRDINRGDQPKIRRVFSRSGTGLSSCSSGTAVTTTYDIWGPSGPPPEAMNHWIMKRAPANLRRR